MVQIRKTNNTIWATDWIEAIPRLGLGKFGFVQCTGVLHHLKSPRLGLNTLKDTQFERGGANLMVYGKYGNTGIYQIQYLLGLINRLEITMDAELSNTKCVLNTLPRHHWYFRLIMIGDLAMGDAGLYDMFLHHRYVSFTFEGLVEWLSRCNMNMIDFGFPSDKINLSPKYKITDHKIYQHISQMNFMKKISISELMSGNVFKFSFYASTVHKSEASLYQVDNVVYTYGSPLGFRNIINNKDNFRLIRNQTHVFAEVVETSVDELATDHKSYEGSWDDSHITVFSWPKNSFSDFCISILTKKPSFPKTTHELITTFKKDTNSTLTPKIIKKLFVKTFEYLKDTGLFLLKNKFVRNFPKTYGFNQFTVKGVVNAR